MGIRRRDPQYLSTLALAVLLATPPRHTFAQDTTALAPGSLIRLKPAWPRATFVRGELLGLSADSLRVRDPHAVDALSFATGDIASLHISRGRRPSTGRSALVGAAAGALLGASCAIADGCPRTRLAVLFALPGLGLGAFVEELARTDRWQRVAPPWVEGRANLATVQQPEGSRVRLYATQTVDGQNGWVAGQVVQWSHETLVLLTDDGRTVAVPAAAVTQLEVSGGQKSNWAEGAAYGWFVGAVTGAVLGLASGDNQSGWITWTQKEMVAIGGLMLGGLGTVIGLTAGASSQSDIWETPRADRVMAASEAPKGTAAPKRGRWSVAAITGTTSSGPARDIEAGMRAAGLNDHSDCWFFCSGRIAHPFSRTGWGQTGFPWLLEVRHRRSRSLGFAAMTSNANIGTTIGYNDDGGLGDFLFLEYGVRTWALVPSAALGPLYVEAGPAFYRASSWRDEVGVDQERRGHNKLGGLVGVGWSIRSVGRFSLDGAVQYRAVGRAKVGPYSFQPTPWQSQTTIPPFPETAASFNHWFVGAGIGLRF